MPGLFQAIELGKRALLTHQATLQTIGHNIANVNTAGYSRQRVTIKSTMPDENANYAVGTGVTATDVRHVRDLFLGQQYRQENKALGQWSYKQKTLSQIESLYAEPSDSSLSDLLNEFWQSWSDLSNNPDSASVRTEILAQANSLVNGFHEMANQLIRLQDAVDGDLVSTANEVNLLVNDIATLNHQIRVSEVGGVQANDLRDTRDQMIDELSRFVDVNTRELKDGTMVVYLGAMALVDGEVAHLVAANTINENGSARHQIVWQGTDIAIKSLSGEIKGVLDSRDKIIVDQLDELNALAEAVVEQVNALHVTGTNADGDTGVLFFDPNFTDAATMRIHSAILADENKIMSGTSGEVSDNRVALEIAQLSERRILNDGTTSIGDFYNSMIGSLGVRTYEATTFTENYELLMNQVENSRQSVQGVSLDEEMTNLVKFQHAYDAAARVITAMDQALDTVIGSMGVVGR